MTNFNYAERNFRKTVRMTALSAIFGLGLMPAFALTACAHQQQAAVPAESASLAQLKEDAQEQVQDKADEQAKPEAEAKTGEEAAPEAPEAASEAAPEAAPVAEPKAETSAGESSTTANGCFAQQDGKVECLCDSEESCATLKESGTCEPGTEWMTEDKVGGCTQKATSDK